jgi:dipeptidyl aminopeptidase/acylaminoacyl peptidase
VIVAVLSGAGCGEEATRHPDLSSAEKIGYVAATEGEGKLLVTSTSGGRGQALLEWQGYGERFSFSNDGRYFTIGLSLGYLVAATDGSSARHIRSGPSMLTFSPDSSRIAYSTLPEEGANEIGIMDVETGASKTLVRSKNGLLVNPTWVDADTLIYTELAIKEFMPIIEGGIIHRIDVDSGATAALTPADRSFSSYNAPVSYKQPRVALTEKGPLYNLWSLDVMSGELKQVSNNTLFQFRSGYLPDSDRILFELQKTEENTQTSELGLLADDGSSFTMLTKNFFFDGLHTFSLESGKIAFQQRNDNHETSIWTINEDGSGLSLIDETNRSSIWLGDPNFFQVEEWREQNPLEMTVVEDSGGETISITVRNTAADTVDATLRAFAGAGLALSSSDDSVSVASDREEAGEDAGSSEPRLEWSLSLAPGEERVVELDAMPQGDIVNDDFALTLTLSVPEAPPRMKLLYLGDAPLTRD